MQEEDENPEVATQSDAPAKPTKKPAKKKAAKKAPVKKKPAAGKKKVIGVDYVAKQLGKDTHSTRVMLRKRKIKKLGKSYEWATQSAADSVVKQLRA